MDAERENGLCHPRSNTRSKDEGGVSCLFQPLVDDNSHLSPHWREARGEAEDCFPTSSLLCSPLVFLSRARRLARHGYKTPLLPARGGRWGKRHLLCLGLGVRGQAWVLMVRSARQSRLTHTQCEQQWYVSPHRHPRPPSSTTVLLSLIGQDNITSCRKRQ